MSDLPTPDALKPAVSWLHDREGASLWNPRSISMLPEKRSSWVLGVLSQASTFSFGPIQKREGAQTTSTINSTINSTIHA